MTKCKSTVTNPHPGEANWAALAFPTDADGLTTNLRREFRNAVVRCRGGDETFQRVLDCLDVLMAWARAKLEDDRADIASMAEAAAARDEMAARQEAFRARVQAGVTIKVAATATGFVEVSSQNGSVLATYDTADDARGPVTAMAQMMLAEGRNPTCILDIQAFGRPGIGSGQTIGQLAGTALGTTAPAPAALGGLIAIQV